MLDLRLPSGVFFTIVGLVLVALGVMTNGNVNLMAGAAMLVFGVCLLLLVKFR